jgi:hypothetical protein
MSEAIHIMIEKNQIEKTRKNQTICAVVKTYEREGEKP